MAKIIESPSLEAYTNIDGKKAHFNVWNIEIHGATIADDYPRLRLTPEDVRRIFERAAEAIDEAIYDEIDNALNEYVGAW